MLYPFYHKIISCIFNVNLTKVFFYNVLCYVKVTVFFFRKLLIYLFRVFIVSVFLFFFHMVLGWDVFFILGVFAIQFAIHFIDWFEIRFFLFGLSAKAGELAVFFFVFLAIVLAIFSLWMIKIMVIFLYVQVTALLLAVGMLEIWLANFIMKAVINHPETMFFLCGIGNFLWLYGVMQWEQSANKTKWVVMTNVLVWSWYIAVITTGWSDEWAIGFWLSLGSLVSIRIGYRNMYEYLEKKNGEKLDELKIAWYRIMIYLQEKPSLATTLIMTVGRVVCQTLVEIRYGISGGVIFMGGTGMTGEEGKEEDDLPPHDNLIPRTEFIETVNLLQNNTELPTQRYQVPETAIDTLPKDPSTNSVVFFHDIVQNVRSFKVMNPEKFKAYREQYDDHRRKCLEFREMTEQTLDEFVSCTLIKISLITDEKGEITKHPFIVNNHPIDLVINGVGYQIKNQGNFSGGDLRNLNIKYRLFKENDNLAFKTIAVYDKIENSERVVAEIKRNPQVVEKLEAVQRGRWFQPTRQTIDNYIDFMEKKATHERNKAAIPINKNVLEAINKQNYCKEWWEGCPKGYFNILLPEKKILQLTKAITPKEAVNKAIVIVRKMPK